MAGAWASVVLIRVQLYGQFSVINPDRGLEYTLSKFAKDTKLGDADSLTYRETFTETVQQTGALDN